MNSLQCLTCCIARKLGDSNVAVREAVTLVPDWQQTVVGGQVLMAAVMVPVCWEHLTVTPKTAVENGRLVTG